MASIEGPRPYALIIRDYGPVWYEKPVRTPWQLERARGRIIETTPRLQIVPRIVRWIERKLRGARRP